MTDWDTRDAEFWQRRAMATEALLMAFMELSTEMMPPWMVEQVQDLGEAWDRAADKIEADYQARREVSDVEK